MQKVRVQRLPELRSELNVSKMDGRGPPVIFLHEEAFVPHSDAASDNRGGPVERTFFSRQREACLGLLGQRCGVAGPGGILRNMQPQELGRWSVRDASFTVVHNNLFGLPHTEEGFWSWLLWTSWLTSLLQLAPSLLVMRSTTIHYVDVGSTAWIKPTLSI